MATPTRGAVKNRAHARNAHFEPKRIHLEIVVAPRSSFRRSARFRLPDHGLPTPRDGCYCGGFDWDLCGLVLVQAVLPGE